MNRTTSNRLRQIINYLMIVLLLVMLIAASTSRVEAKPEKPVSDSEVKVIEVNQTLMAMSLQSGVAIDDAVTAMMAAAEETSMQLVGRKQVSKALNKRGIKSRHLEVLQFCNAEEAVQAVEYSMVYAAYIPCQITVVEDPEGKVWLITRNMDVMIDNEMISARLAEIAIRVNQSMLKIMSAGVTGSL